MDDTLTKSIVLNENDDVAVALTDLAAGTVIDIRYGNASQRITLRDNIKRMHKFALRDIEKGRQIIKYGQSIGMATAGIKEGEHVHSHNLVSIRGQTSKPAV